MTTRANLTTAEAATLAEQLDAAGRCRTCGHVHTEEIVEILGCPVGVLERRTWGRNDVGTTPAAERDWEVERDFYRQLVRTGHHDAAHGVFEYTIEALLAERARSAALAARLAELEAALVGRTGT